MPRDNIGHGDAASQPGHVRSLRAFGRTHWVDLGLLMFGMMAYSGLVLVELIDGTLTHGAIPRTLGWVGLAFVVYLGALLLNETRARIDMRLIWVGAIGFRVLLLFTTPTLSSDIYRYLWDGYVANNGVSPYAFPIDAPEMDRLDTSIRALANHQWMASPYLPAAQWFFAIVTRVGPLQPASMQIAVVAVDLLNGVLIIALLATAQLPRQHVLIYLWNPLAVVEGAHGAHVDIWMVFLTLLALWLAIGQRPWAGRESRYARHFDRVARSYLAPIALGLATLTKILPVLLLPVFFWSWRWRRLVIYATIVAMPLLWAGSRAGWGLTGPLDGKGLFAALRIYGDQWNFNSGLFHWLEVALMDSSVLNLSPAEANRWAKGIVALVMSAIVLAVWIRARGACRTRARLRLMSVPLMAYVLLAPTMHPWYLLLLLAFVPFLAPASDEWRGGWLAVLPWIYLSAALFLSYLTYVNPLDLREYEWVRRVEWYPVFVLLLIGLAGRFVYQRTRQAD